MKIVRGGGLELYRSKIKRLFFSVTDNKSDDLRYSFGESAVFTQRLENNRKKENGRGSFCMPAGKGRL